MPDLACTMRSAKSAHGRQGSPGARPAPRPARPLTQPAAPQRDGLQLHRRRPMEAGRLQPRQHRRRQQQRAEVGGAAGHQHVPGADPARRLPGRRHLGAAGGEVSREPLRNRAGRGARRPPGGAAGEDGGGSASGPGGQGGLGNGPGMARERPGNGSGTARTARNERPEPLRALHTHPEPRPELRQPWGRAQPRAEPTEHTVYEPTEHCYKK